MPIRDDSVARPRDRTHASLPGSNRAATQIEADVEDEEAVARLQVALERLVERFEDARPAGFVTLATRYGKEVLKFRRREHREPGERCPAVVGLVEQLDEILWGATEHHACDVRRAAIVALGRRGHPGIREHYLPRLRELHAEMLTLFWYGTDDTPFPLSHADLRQLTRFTICRQDPAPRRATKLCSCRQRCLPKGGTLAKWLHEAARALGRLAD